MKEDVANIINHLLLELGVPSNFLGFTYIAFAVMLIMERPEHNFRASKELYFAVAQHFGTTHTCVERCIRYAIATGWTMGSRDLIEQIFINTLNPRRAIPTNSQYISSLCLYLCSLQAARQVQK